jgi:hypothetical protein
MELRPAKDKEQNYIDRFLRSIPEVHRAEVHSFTSNWEGKTRGYHLLGGQWMIDDDAEMLTWTEWYCPTQQRACLCPGPCPDGTPHTKIENN